MTEKTLTAAPVDRLVRLPFEPFYDRDGITIYNADCRQVLPFLDRFDLLLTDPPYGIGRSGQAATYCKNPRHSRKEHIDHGWDDATPTRGTFELMFERTENQVVWGGNYFCEQLPPTMGWIAWDKGQDFSTSDFELAFTSFDKAARRIVVNRGAIAREGALHPTQKPLAVVKFCLTYAGESVRSVLDPFMGCGTTLVAAKLLGLRAVGIEINREYCEAAVRRLSQRVLDFGGMEAAVPSAE